MDLLIILISTFLAITLIHVLQILKYRVQKLPPGPIPLPIIGNLHIIGSQPHKSVTELCKTYGPVMFLKLGQVNTVVISSPSLAKEVLQKQDVAYSNRTVPDALRALNHNKYAMGFLPAADSRWRSLRKIVNVNMFTSSALAKGQELRRKKVEELITYCKKRCENGEAVDLGLAALRTNLNLLSNTILSRDLMNPFSDSGKEFKDLVDDIEIECGKPNLSDYFPVIREMDVQGIRKQAGVYFMLVIDVFNKIIDERLEKRHDSTDTKDFLDILLALSRDSPDEVDRVQIDFLLVDLFIAGTDTTSSVVEWAMAELLRNPHVLRKAKAELAKVVGKGKVITDEDVEHLPYLQCVLKETLRIYPQAPFLIPRKVDQDMILSGYLVPKDSQILVNVWAIARDDSIWENPLEFRPERFLDSDVDVKGLDFEVLPFGAGRRICPGMSMAMKVMPLMIGSLLNCFDWEIEGGVKPEDLNMDDKFGLTLVKARHLRAVPTLPV